VRATDLVLEGKTMPFQSILYDKQDHIVWITMNRPHSLNALNRILWRELYKALEKAEKDRDVNVIVITGAGRAFSAGDDIKDVASLKSQSEIRDFFFNYAVPTVMKLIESTKPIIAAVNGPAYGGGCEIVMLCDMSIASEDAVFAVPEARVGALPPIASAIGAYLIGKLNTTMLALIGDPISAQEAKSMGMVNKVVPAEELKKTVEEIANKLMLSAPTSIRAIKKIMSEQIQLKQLERAVEELIALFEVGEAREGHDAFIKKRLPEWISTR
jgi:enoyl-CoA hydratase/3-hydroxyacyl-CoA dehydrogenase